MIKRWVAALCALSLSVGLGRAEGTLEQGFVAPPASARPQTWWHWMNGNITKEGITADLEAMQRVGIGGAEIFNAAEGIPHGPIQFNSPEWRAMVKHAAQEADRLGLELCIHNCGGWSSSGGPWNTPEHGMQVVVTSETPVTGPVKFAAVLPQPPTKLNCYRDIAVLAFRRPAAEIVKMQDLAPTVTTSVAKLNGAKLVDGKSNTWIGLPLPTAQEPQFVQLEFAQPLTARELVLTPGPGMMGCNGKLEISDDGTKFRVVDSLAMPRGGEKRTFSFAPVTAKVFRVVFTSANKKMKQLALAEVEVSARLGIENLPGKAFYDRGGDYRLTGLPTATPADVVARDQIVDLSKDMAADGKLTWDVPEGNWSILRIGYTPNGMRNHPSPAEGEGLECDKLSKEAAQAHWDGLMAPLLADLGPLVGKSFNGVLIDSYEVGTQNWTPEFRAEFQKRRGYDPVAYLPVLTGRVVDSPEITERFLWDFRRTIADLFAENYSGQFAAMAHQNKLLYSVEPYGNCPTDDIQYGQYADIPMSEFWPGAAGNTNPGNAHLAASIGHVFGRKFVGAESFTAAPDAGKWLKDPYSLKAQGDTVYCAGVNRIIYHRYAHQPWLNRFPGMTMGQWGTHFERTVTWWEQSTAWLKYQARCQYLLQSGLFVADALFFCGEGAPNELRGSMPAGYDYDGCNTDALLTRLTVKDGRLVLPDGMTYRLLVLPADGTMTPAVLRKIKELADAGATIIGPKPLKSPSLAHYPQCDAEVKQLADELWGKAVQDKSPAEALAALHLAPDFACPTPKTRLTYIHRTVDGAEVYFVANSKDKPEAVDCTFRVAGKAPELWHPDSGRMEMAPVFTQADGLTTVPLKFDPSGSVFVVFRSAAGADHFVAAGRTGGPAAVAAPEELTILNAQYGPLDNGGVNTGCADVTAAVKTLVENKAQSIPANNDLGGDPAPDLVKEMRVEFLVDGKSQSVTVEENQSIPVPAGAKVVRAIYGVLPTDTVAPKPPVDVTAQLAGMVKAGTLSVHVDNNLVGHDPAYLVVKALRVTYRYRGQEKVAQATEHQDLELPEDDARPAGAPTWELALDAQGQPHIQTWQPGMFELKTAAGKVLQAPVADVAKPVEVAGPWELRFPPNWGAPASVTLDKLISWTEHPDTGVKYFSGTATYTKDIEIAADLLGAGKGLYLDLGQLKNLAQVTFNGKDLGILWKPPFMVDIGTVAQAGKNKLTVKVTNLWPNRLIGDEQLPDDRVWQGKNLKEWPQWVLDGKPSPTGRFTFTTWHHWYKDDAPLPSGLLGPVVLRPTVKVEVK